MFSLAFSLAANFVAFNRRRRQLMTVDDPRLLTGWVEEKPSLQPLCKVNIYFLENLIHNHQRVCIHTERGGALVVCMKMSKW